MVRLTGMAMLLSALCVLAGPAAADAPSRPETMSYGADDLQALDFWRARDAGRPAPLVVFVHVLRKDSIRQSRALGDALRAAGTAAEVHGLAGTGMSGHREINMQLGDADYPGTAIVDQWPAGVVGP